MAGQSTSMRRLAAAALRKLADDGPVSLASSISRLVHHRVERATISLLIHSAIDRNELLTRCYNQNQVHYYGTQETFSFAPPLGEHRTEAIDALVGTYTCSRDFVCELQNARLIGPDGITQDQTGRLVIEPMGTENRLKSCLRETIDGFGFTWTVSELCRTVGPSMGSPDHEIAISFIPRHGRDYDDVNYGHWLAEDIPKIRAVEAYREQTGQTPTVILRPNPPDWMYKTLQLAGLSADDWTTLNTTTSAEKLLVPRQNYVHSRGSELRPDARRWVGKRFRSAVDLEEYADRFASRVYVSRQGMDRRRLSNFDMVLSELEPLGFEAYRPEQLSIREQVALFAGADIVVGPTGSGLMNILFSTNTTLIELLPPAADPTVFYLVANECGHAYDYLRTDPATGVSESIHDDVVVNPVAVRDAVERALSG